MTQNQTWQCPACHTNNGLDVLLCRHCETTRPKAARRGPQHGQTRPPASAPWPAMTPPLAPRPITASQPTPPVAWKPRPGVLFGVFAVVLVLVVFALQIDWRDGSPSESTTADSAPGTGQLNGAVSEETAPPVPLSSRELLEQQLAADRSKVSALEEWWVPQVSSKKVGLVVAGKQFTIDDVYADYLSWKGRFPDALLLWSGDYASFKHADFWVVVVAQRFSDYGSANGWCDQKLLAPDDCFARRVSHDVGDGRNSVQR